MAQVTREDGLIAVMLLGAVVLLCLVSAVVGFGFHAGWAMF